MAGLQSRLSERVAIGLIGGLVLTAAATMGFWAGSYTRFITRGVGPGAASSVEPANTTSRRRTEPPQAVPGDDEGRIASSRLFDPDRADPPDDQEPESRRTAQYGGRERRGIVEDGDSEEVAVFAALERLERRMAAGMKRARDSVVAIEYASAEGPPGSRRLATGVVINSSGDVLSVRIDPPSRIAASSATTVILARDATGLRHAAQWVAADPESGLTLLKIAPRAVRPISIAADGPALGGQVFVVGNPFGLGHSVSRGHVAGLDRALKLGQRQIGGLIQVQAPLYPGDSGAVVTNLRGQLLGLIRSGLAIPAAPGDHAERDNDFGFAIATRDLLWVADQLRARGRVDRAYLGVRLQSSTSTGRVAGGTRPADAATSGGQDGAFLQEVLSGTPAALAGLRSGDAIIAVNGEPVHSSPDLTDRLDRLPAQATLHLEVLRGALPTRKPLRFVLQTTSRPDLEQPSHHLARPSVLAPAPAAPTETVSATVRPAASNSNEPGIKPKPAGPVNVIPTSSPATARGTGPESPALSASIPAAKSEEAP